VRRENEDPDRISVVRQSPEIPSPSIRSIPLSRSPSMEIARQATPFFVRGDRGIPDSLSKINLEHFDEYLKGIEALAAGAAGEGRSGREVKTNLIDKLAQIRTINAAELNKTPEAAAGIDNVKAYTNSVTDLLKDAQACAEHQGLTSFGNAEQRLKFESLAALLLQTKRLVRGVGAEKILIDSANALDNKLTALMSTRPDSTFTTTKTVAVTPPKIFTKFTGGKVDNVVVDEQGLLLYFPAATVSVAGHGTVGIASMTGGVTGVLGKDNFRAAMTFSDLLKTTLNEKANATWIKSNGTVGRNFLKTLNAVRSGLGFLTGQLAADEFSPSIYSDYKLGNTRVETAFAVNDAVQKSEVGRAWKHDVDALVKKFFLPLTKDIIIRQEGDLPPPADPFHVISELIKGSFSDHGANFTAQIGQHWQAGTKTVGLSETNVLSYDRLHFGMQLPSKPSDLLDTTFHQDVRETLKLHNEIIQKLNLPPGSREQAGIFTQYKRMNEEFSGLPRSVADREFTLDEVDYFGEKSSVPAAFHGPILSPSQGTIDSVGNSLADLAGKHDQVIRELSRLGVHKGLPTGIKRTIKETQEEVFRNINEHVWDNTYPGKLKDITNKPEEFEKFKRQTFYNLEIGLGRVGIEIAMLNRHKEQGNTASFSEDQLQDLNVQYSNLKRTLTSRDFMGNPNKDFGLSPLKTTAEFNKHQVTVSGTLVAGANLSKLFYPTDVTPSNVAGDLYIKLQAQYQNATNQFDPTREGQFLLLSFELSSGLLSAVKPEARLQEHIVHAVSKAAMAMVGRSIKNDKVKFSDQTWKDLAQQVISVVGTNVQAGTRATIKIHKPAENAEWRLQKVTEFKTQQGGIDGNVPFVEIKVLDSTAKQEQQILGPDWSVHKMTVKYLTAAIGNKDPIVLNDEMANRYCSRPNTISQLIDDAMSWTGVHLASLAPQTAAVSGQPTQDGANQDGNRGGNRPPYPSDIHRFLGNEIFVRSGEIAPVVQKNAPGSSTTQAESPLAKMEELCRQLGEHAPGVTRDWTSDDWAATKTLWDAEKTQIESLKTLDERRAYWATDRGNELLKAFVKMVGIYTDVTTAVAKHADKEHQATKSGMVNDVKLDRRGLADQIQYRARQLLPQPRGAGEVEHPLNDIQS